MKKSIVRYIVISLFVYVCSVAEVKGLHLFAIGALGGLVYCKANVLVLTPIYAGCQYLVNGSIESAIVGLLPPIVYAIAYLIHTLYGRPARLYHLAIYTLIGSMPPLIYAILNGNIWYPYAIESVAGVGYCLVVAVVGYAVIVRGMRYRFTTLEMSCLFVVLLGVGVGLGSIRTLLSPIYIVGIFATLLATHSIGLLGGLSVASLIGVGAVASSGESVPLVIMLAVAMLSLTLKSRPICMSLVGVMIGGVILYASGTFDYYAITSIGLGAMLYWAIGERGRGMLASDFVAVRDKYATRTLINRNRRDISARLYEVGQVFSEMENLIKLTLRADNTDKDIEVVLDRVQGEYCRECDGYSHCQKLLNGKVSSVMRDSVAVGLKRGKINLAQLPTYITGNCPRASAYISTVNNVLAIYNEQLATRRIADRSKVTLAEQLGSVCKILENIADDISHGVSFDTVVERRLIDELAYVNVVCTEAVVYNDNSGERVSIVVRESDSHKPSIMKVISKVFRCSMYCEKGVSPHEGYTLLNFRRSPTFDVICGRAGKSRDEGEPSGDNHGVLRLKDSRCVVALCDGMGSGESANEESSTAVCMIEGLYKAGFPHDTVIDLINKLLSMRDAETFSSVDMCVINPMSGQCDLIKMGSAGTYLKRKNDIELIESTALPVGVVDDITPSLTRKKLASGDMVVMMSDGVEDSLGVAGVSNCLREYSGTNPQILAERLLNLANKGQMRDDMTVLVMRVAIRV